MRRTLPVGLLLFSFIAQAADSQAAAPAAPAPVAAATATAAPPVPPPPPPPPRLNALPVEHAYQKTLRTYLASLKEKDFEHGITASMDGSHAVTDPEEQYRYYFSTLTLHPLVGTKRGVPSVNAPSKLFTLAYIETPEGVKRPPIYADAMAQLIHWKYDGNPYYGSKALKLRAFVSAVISLVMLDEQLEHAPQLGGSRTDWLAPSVLAMAFPYQYVTDVVPEPVRKAYRTGLEKMGRRILNWGPKGEEPNLDVVATVALWYIAQALDDPKFSAEAEAYAKRFFTDPQSFHPAGYFVDRNGIDLGFSGQTNYFATWLALVSKWPFVVEAVDKIHRLRAHVTLPQPDGKLVLGPSHYHNRFSADASRDQWEWGAFRDTAASLVTDEAAYLTNPITTTILAGAAKHRAQFWQFQINENPKLKTPGYMKTEDISNSLWKFGIWPSYNFPAQVNYGYVAYPAGAYAHRKALEDANSPLLKSPFLRDENFVREFDQAFFVTKQPTYAAIVHSGPIGEFDQDSSFALLPGPYGFGGGQLSAFWTPKTGSVLLGRRGGQHWEANFDLLEDWRKWPLHAVSGTRVDDKIFTTARIAKPEVTSDLKADGGTVRVSGIVPRNMLGQKKALDGRVEFARTFTLLPDGVRVETTLHTTGQDNFSELFESLPVLLREGALSPKATEDTATKVEFRRGKQPWTAASGEWSEGVTAVRLARFDGAVTIEFDRPRRVKLGDEWSDKFLSRVVCRNVLIDLIEQGDQPAVVREAGTSYTIRAERK